MEEPDLKDPNVFSGEVHFALLTEGLRSPRLRRLMRTARGDSELARLFETKVASFRRFVRETRTPTVWNLPVRMGEWFGDHAKFNPPREVFSTLVYVALVLVAIDFGKKHWQSGRAQDGVFVSYADMGAGRRYGPEESSSFAASPRVGGPATAGAAAPRTPVDLGDAERARLEQLLLEAALRNPEFLEKLNRLQADQAPVALAPPVAPPAATNGVIKDAAVTPTSPVATAPAAPSAAAPSAVVKASAPTTPAAAPSTATLPTAAPPAATTPTPPPPTVPAPAATPASAPPSTAKAPSATAPTAVPAIAPPPAAAPSATAPPVVKASAATTPAAPPPAAKPPTATASPVKAPAETAPAATASAVKAPTAQPVAAVATGTAAAAAPATKQAEPTKVTKS